MATNRILVVDDDAETREFLAEVFQDQDWEVAQAATPESALDAAVSADLVLSDIRLEAAVDGIGLLKKIKARNPDVPVILMTGFGTLETAVEAVREGSFDFISKP